MSLLLLNQELMIMHFKEIPTKLYAMNYHYNVLALMHLILVKKLQHLLNTNVNNIIKMAHV